MNRKIPLVFSALMFGGIFAADMTGYYNTWLGYIAGINADGERSTMQGAGAGGEATGIIRTDYVGAAAGAYSSNMVDCVGMGYRALRNAANMTNVVAIGTGAFTNRVGLSNATWLNGHFYANEVEEEFWLGYRRNNPMIHYKEGTLFFNVPNVSMNAGDWGYKAAFGFRAFVKTTETVLFTFDGVRHVEMQEDLISIPDGWRDNLYAVFGSETATACAGFALYGNVQIIELPNVRELESYCFDGCGSLRSVKVPKCSSLGSSCFIGCKELELLDFGNEMTTVPAVGSDGLGFETQTRIIVPDALVSIWKTSPGWTPYAGWIVGWGEYYGGKVGAVSRGALAGKTYDMTNEASMSAALRDIITALGGTVSE